MRQHGLPPRQVTAYPASMRSFLLVMCLLPAIGWMPPAPAQVRRCSLPDGSLIYTDRQCEAIGARERLPPVLPADGPYQRRMLCARSPQELADGLAAAVQSGDANRIAALYDWTGMGSHTANAVMDRLQAIADRGLVDVQVLRSRSADSDADTPQRFDETSGQLLTPAPRPSRILGLQLSQVQKNGYTPINTRFGMHRRMDCWWLQP